MIGLALEGSPFINFCLGLNGANFQGNGFNSWLIFCHNHDLFSSDKFCWLYLEVLAIRWYQDPWGEFGGDCQWH